MATALRTFVLRGDSNAQAPTNATPRSKTREYRIWCSMRARCIYPSASGYKRYGGRGIKVCERWAHSFDAFLEDMGPCPPGYSIDRIDPHGNYEPGNCRWLSMAAQASTRTNNRLVEYQGEVITAAELSRRTGIPHARILYRLSKGWSVDQVLSIPKQRRPPQVTGRAILTIEKVRGIRKLLKAGTNQEEIGRLFGISRQTVSAIKRKEVWQWLD